MKQRCDWSISGTGTSLVWLEGKVGRQVLQRLREENGAPFYRALQTTILTLNLIPSQVESHRAALYWEVTCLNLDIKRIVLPADGE